MKLFKLILNIIVWIAMVFLAIIGIRFLVCGGWQTFKDKLAELDNNFWEFIKWFFSSMWSK